MEDNQILKVENLFVSFKKKVGKSMDSVIDLSFFIEKKKTLAIVGESGSGKSVTAKAILGLLPKSDFCRVKGNISFRGVDLGKLPEKEMMKIRGKKISMIFQEPMSALNPLHTIGKQIGEAFFIHSKLSYKNSRAKVIELLDKVGIKNPETRYNSYPHELSGGQRQRVMIAMAIAEKPDLLIADEPTTALDVTIQQEILKLLENLKKELGMSMLFISHDLELVKNTADNVLVMKNGEMIEYGSVEKIFSEPENEYTKELINSSDQVVFKSNAVDENILNAKGLRVWFPVKKGLLKRTSGYVKAVDGVSFFLKKGEVLAIVGESGSGKTSLGLSLLRLVPFSGEILFRNKRLDLLKFTELRKQRAKFQVVFQDPFGSLNPRMTVYEIVSEGLLVHRKELSSGEKRSMAETVVMEAGLDRNCLDHYPHEFSGGQRQRIAIARAVIPEPEVILLDEPTSSLDRSVQFQVLLLLKKIQEKRNLSYIFISHDLKLVKKFADRIIVMKNGKVEEENTSEELFLNPESEYTKKLISASFY